MKKCIIILLSMSLLLFVTACSNSSPIQQDSVGSSVKTDQSSQEFVPTLVEMTDADVKAIEDSIEVYFMIDPTLMDCTVKYGIESNDENHTIFYNFENASINPDFEFDLLSSLSGALSVSTLSVPYKDIRVSLLDVNGDIIESKIFDKAQ